MTAPAVRSDRAEAPALRLTGASLAFAGVTVLNNVSLKLARGEIRALVGKNGSGKSSLIKILSGFHNPAPGARLQVNGLDIALPAPPERLRQAGLSFVHQDLALNPDATILDNLLVGRFSTAGLAPIAWRREKQRVQSALQRFGASHPPHRQVRDLAAVDRALVAIARGFIDAEENGGVVVLDEPTAFLGEADTERLLAAIRKLRESGHAVLYVSHRLSEVLSLADSVTVLRDGAIVHEGFAAGLSIDTLIGHILGADIRRFYPDRQPAQTDLALAADSVSGPVVKSLSIALRRGEIVGVTGLSGAGFDELPYLLTGALPARGGAITVGGRQLPAQGLRPHDARRLGMALLPADRRRESGAQQATLRENVSLPVLDRFFSRGRIRVAAERDAVRKLLLRFGVRPPDPEAPLYTLSGGNQQKALLAKWMQTAPEILLLHEPTQGVDVGSKQDIFREIERAAQLGVAVLIASAETADLANLCHRVVVLRNGVCSGELSGVDLSEQAINDLSFRGAASAGKDGLQPEVVTV